MFIALSVTLLLVCSLLTARLLKYRRSYHQLAGKFKSPIPVVHPGEICPALQEDSIGPSCLSEVHFIGCGSGSNASTSDREAWILAVLAKQCTQIFEFGTATGRTCYIMARNCQPGGHVTTLTLAADGVDAYLHGENDSEQAARIAAKESTFEKFLYSGTPAEAQITQLYGDSKAFDESAYLNRFDLIFIDGSHAYSYVASDTAKALRMIRPGGLIVWHDYRPPSIADTVDVYRFLNELSRTRPLVRFEQASLVVARID